MPSMPTGQYGGFFLGELCSYYTKGLETERQQDSPNGVCYTILLIASASHVQDHLLVRSW